MDELLEASSTARVFWEESRVEGLRLAARLGLEHHLGTLPADLLQDIDAANGPTLTAVITHPEEPLEQVRARLGLAGGTQ